MFATEGSCSTSPAPEERNVYRNHRQNKSIPGSIRSGTVCGDTENTCLSTQRGDDPRAQEKRSKGDYDDDKQHKLRVGTRCLAEDAISILTRDYRAVELSAMAVSQDIRGERHSLSEHLPQQDGRVEIANLNAGQLLA